MSVIASVSPEIQELMSGRPRPKTLLVFGREPGSLRGINASGGYGFLHDMLLVAGGDDVFDDVKRQSVDVTTEMVLARRPEVIIELRYGDGATAADAAGYARWLAARSENFTRADSHVFAREGLSAAMRASSRLAACARSIRCTTVRG